MSESKTPPKSKNATISTVPDGEATPVIKGSHVYLVDGSGYIFRAFHALPPLTRPSDGIPVGAVHGFCAMLWKLFDLHEAECQRLLKAGDVVLPAYDQVLKCSHIFNLLDARGAISVTERVGVIGRVRRLALGIAQAWMKQNEPQSEAVA